MRFDFDGKIEKEVLENYLSRCATAAGLYQSETLSDDLPFCCVDPHRYAIRKE